MTVYKSDNMEWTDKDEQITVQKVSEMIASSKSNIQKHRDTFCDVYDITMGEEKAKIINIKTEENQSGSWKIFAGKFEQQGIGPFVDNSEFDKNFSNGKGIRHSINNKIAAQLALKTHTQGINR